MARRRPGVGTASRSRLVPTLKRGLKVTNGLLFTGLVKALLSIAWWCAVYSTGLAGPSAYPPEILSQGRSDCSGLGCSGIHRIGDGAAFGRTSDCIFSIFRAAANNSADVEVLLSAA